MGTFLEVKIFVASLWYLIISNKFLSHWARFIKTDWKCHPLEPDVSPLKAPGSLLCQTISFNAVSSFASQDMFKEMSLEIRQGSAVTTCYLELG